MDHSGSTARNSPNRRPTAHFECRSFCCVLQEKKKRTQAEKKAEAERRQLLMAKYGDVIASGLNVVGGAEEGQG